jgi:hypothetical protein
VVLFREKGPIAGQTSFGRFSGADGEWRDVNGDCDGVGFFFRRCFQGVVLFSKVTRLCVLERN